MADTGCGVGRIGDKWNTAIFGTDVRAFRSAYNSPAGSPVTRILMGLLGWIDEVPTSVEHASNTPPSVFLLDQNYPNPFNPTTSIRYSVPQDGIVSLVIFNLLGQKVVTLVNQNMIAGNYEVKFDASHYASGIYFYRLDAGVYSSVKKMILLK